MKSVFISIKGEKCKYGGSSTCLIYKHYWEYFIASMPVSCAFSLLATVNGIIIGNFLGSSALAAVYLLFPIITFFNAVSLFCSIGGSMIAARAKGEMDSDVANVAYTLTIVLLLLSSGIITSIGLFAQEGILNILCAGKTDLLVLMRPYYQVTVIGNILYLFIPAYVPFVQLDSSPKRAMSVLLVTNIISLLSGCFLIYVCKLGMFGGGLAPLFGFLCGGALFIPYLFSSGKTFRFVRLTKKNFSILKSMLKMGLSPAWECGVTLCMIVGVNTILLHYLGENSVAVFAVGFNLWMVLDVIAVSSGQTLILFSSLLFGEKDFSNMRKLFGISLMTMLFFIGVIGGLAVMFPGITARIFGIVNPDMIQEATGVLPFFVIHAGLFSTVYLFINQWQAGNHPFLSLTLPVMESIVGILGCFYLSAKFMPEYLWYSFPAAGVLTMGYIFLVGFFVKHLKKGYGGILLLPNNDSKSRRSIEIEVSADVTNWPSLLQTIKNFCETEKISSEVCYKITLCIEESVMNIIHHGYHFRTGSVCLVKIVITDDHALIRIRDEARPFNPLAWNERQGELRLGLQLIKKMVSSVKYTYVLKFNTLQMEIPLMNSVSE